VDKLTGKVVGVRSVLCDHGASGEISHLVTIRLDRLPGIEDALSLGQELVFAASPQEDEAPQDDPGTGPDPAAEELTGEPEPSAVIPDQPAAKVCGECGAPLPTGRGSHLRRYCKECAPKVARRKKKESRKRKKKPPAKKVVAAPESVDPAPQQAPTPEVQPVAEAESVEDIIEFATSMVDAPGTANMFILLEMVQNIRAITPTKMGMVREDRGDEWLLERCKSAAGLKELDEAAATMEPEKQPGEIEIDFEAEGIAGGASIPEGPGVQSGASIAEASNLEMIVIPPRAGYPQP